MPKAPADHSQGHIDDYPEGPVLGITCTGDPDLDPDELVYEGPVEPDDDK